MLRSRKFMISLFCQLQSWQWHILLSSPHKNTQKLKLLHSYPFIMFGYPAIYAMNISWICHEDVFHSNQPNRPVRWWCASAPPQHSPAQCPRCSSAAPPTWVPRPAARWRRCSSRGPPSNSKWHRRLLAPQHQGRRASPPEIVPKIGMHKKMKRYYLIKNVVVSPFKTSADQEWDLVKELGD